MSPLRADFVAEVFCPSECVRLIQDQASMRNVDSRIHSLRFDCCVFLFYNFSAVTFATQSALRVSSQPNINSVAIGGEADMPRPRRCINPTRPIGDILRRSKLRGAVT